MVNHELEQIEFPNKHFNEMDQSQDQTIRNIQELQQMEKDLYKKLDTSVSGEAVSKEESKKIINRINELSLLRQNLFKSLRNMYSLLRNNVTNARQNLVNDMTNIGIVEKELNNAKRQIEVLQTQKNNKLRMVEINKYYSSNYQNHSNIMKIIILTCIPILIISFIHNKGFLSDNISNLLISLALGIGLIYLFFQVKDIYFRDNMNYDEYNFNILAKGSPSSNTEDDDPYPSVKINTKFDDNFGCFGKNCCSEGTSYNSEKNKCESLNETMISGDLSKYSLNDNIFDTVNLTNTNSVKPFSNKNNYANV